VTIAAGARRTGCDDRRVTVLVEGFEPDQIELARHLAGAGMSVRLAAAGPASPEALSLAAPSHRVSVEPYADLDADPGPADVAYLDVWTPDVAPRVRKLRARGTRVTSLGDLVLERAQGVTVGVTGTAGKTTATSIAVQVLRAAGISTDASTTGRLGNVWPTAELLDRPDPARLLVLELTSSHLAFMRESPRIAAITCFWPDHLELHGSLDAYRAAKEVIVRGQRPGDTVVVNAEDPAARAFAEVTPADLVEVSLERPVERGAFLRDGTVLLRWDGAETTAGPPGRLPAGAAQRLDLLVALAVAVAAGAPPGALHDVLAQVDLPAHRSRALGGRAAARTPGGAAVIDDGMAATPSKAAAALAGYPDRSVVLIAGGLDDLGAGPVHATPEELELLARACDEVARCVLLAVLFGPAAERLEPLLTERGVPLVRAAGFEEAVALALSGVEGAAALVFSPMFPVGVTDRERFATLACGRQAGAGR